MPASTQNATKHLTAALLGIRQKLQEQQEQREHQEHPNLNNYVCAQKIKANLPINNLLIGGYLDLGMVYTVRCTRQT